MTFSAYPRPVIGDLYRLDFADGKSYIGASIRSRKRYEEHRRLALQGNTAPVHAAWRLHGKPTFTILERGLQNDALWRAERNAIYHYNTLMPHGYNCMPGSEKAPGHLGFVASLETRKKLSNFHSGKKLTLEHAEKISKALTGKTRPAHSEETKKKMRLSHRGSIGYKHTDETKQKIRLVQLGRKHSAETCEKRRLTAIKMWEDRKKSGVKLNWKKPPKICSNCQVPAIPSRKGLCSTCAAYLRRVGAARPLLGGK